MQSSLRPAIVMTLLMTVITGMIYPALMTGLAQVLFPYQANGSIATVQGKAVGSTLIGQEFTSPGYFWSRPSATGPGPYNAAASSGSNLGPSNPVLRDSVQARVSRLRAADPGNTHAVPADLVTASASGLDPHITLAAALFQVPRVARARAVPEDSVAALVHRLLESSTAGILGEARVNVLLLNLALDHQRVE